MDEVAFLDYLVSVSNQTGNTALLGVGTLGLGGGSISLANVVTRLVGPPRVS